MEEQYSELSWEYTNMGTFKALHKHCILFSTSRIMFRKDQVKQVYSQASQENFSCLHQLQPLEMEDKTFNYKGRKTQQEKKITQEMNHMPQGRE